MADDEMLLRIRSIDYDSELDLFEVEFEDGLLHEEWHDEIREANGIAPKATIQRLEIERWFRRGFILHYNTGEVAAVELTRRMMNPINLHIGSHEYAVNYHALTIDGTSYEMPMQDIERSKFFDWMNTTVIPKLVEEAAGDRETKE